MYIIFIYMGICMCMCIYIYLYYIIYIFADFKNFGVLNLKENKKASYRDRHFSVLLLGTFLLGMVKCVFIRLTYLKCHIAFHHGNCVITIKKQNRDYSNGIF